MGQDDNLGEIMKKERKKERKANHWITFLKVCIVLLCVNKTNIYYSKHHLFFIFSTVYLTHLFTAYSLH